MRKNSTRLLGVAATALIGMTAWAGSKVNSTVNINKSSDGSGFARGSLASARNSPDSVQYIGCNSLTYSDGSTDIICFARNASNVSVYCGSVNPGFVAAVQSLKGDSELTFNWNSSGDCTLVSVSNFSYFAPKSP